MDFKLLCIFLATVIVDHFPFAIFFALLAATDQVRT